MNEPQRRVLTVVGALLFLAAPAAAQQQLWFVDSESRQDWFGRTSVGPDLDGDGLPELLISAGTARCANQFDGYVTIYSTSTGLLHQWCGSGGAHFGLMAEWVDDLDGGGLPDIFIAEPNYYDAVYYLTETGRYQIYSTETKQLIQEVVGTQHKGRFSVPMAVVDDYDGDGLRDLLIGGPDYGYSYNGEAWIYSLATGARLRTHVGVAWGAKLGRNVAALGDVDGDGFGDYALRSEVWWGRAWVMSGATGLQLLRVDGASYGDAIGFSISAAGDLDGDGLDDVLFGGIAGAGHVDAWSPISDQMVWSVVGGTAGDWFGGNCVAVGDLNGDGFDEFLVAAFYDDHVERDAGRVDLISGRSLRPLYRFTSGIEGLDSYGAVLARGVDFDRDGIEDLIIGTPYEGWYESKGGHVGIYAGNDLWLQADPLDPGGTDLITLDLRGAEPGRLGLIALIAVDGVAQFSPLWVAPFDPNGELQFTALSDPSVSGSDFTVIGYAENRAGPGPLMVSSPATVSVQ